MFPVRGRGMVSGVTRTVEELQGETLRLLVDTYGKDSADYVVAVNGERLDPDFDPPAI